MRPHGQNHRKDANADAWVKDIRKLGAKVFPIGRPADYLVRWGGRLYLVELTNPANKYRRRDPKQTALLEEWGAAIVSDVEGLLRVVGAM